MYATNRGLGAVAVSVTATNTAGTVCAAGSFPALSIPSGGVANIGGLIDTGIRTCFPTIDADNGKVSVDLTFTTASATVGTDVEVTSAYNVSGNRNVVINTSN